MKPVYVTGYGITCAIGDDSSSVRGSLMSGTSGIRTISGIPGMQKSYPGGQVQRSSEALTGDSAWVGSRTSALAISAIRDLLDQASFIADLRSAFISGSSVGGMDVSEQVYHSEVRDHGAFRHHSIGSCTSEVCKYFDWQIFMNTISTACSSAANAIMLSARMIRAGRKQRIIAGGTDALSLFTMRGFDSLMIYDEAKCRPFDASRKGLNLGEGAAYLLLESEESIGDTGNKPIARIAGWSNANDAFHATASSPEGLGAKLAMVGALHCAGISPGDIDYINAHGTATPNNDLSEATAITGLFAEVPPFSSTKSLTGHTLAAAGALEAVFSIMSIEESMMWGNVNYRQQMPELPIAPVTANTSAPIRNVLSNSFGFGGNNTSLVITAV